MRFILPSGMGYCLLLLAGFSSSLVADQSLLDETESYLGEIPVIVSATRLRQKQTEAPATITIIDREMIEASGAIEIADLFRLVPGMQIGQGDTPTYSVTLHGQTDSFSRRIQVMVDGRPVYGPVFSSVDWHALGVDLADIDHIEVVRGPSASAFGENAFSGAINIVTKQPFETRGWFVKATGGSQDTRKGFLRYGDNYQDLDYRASFSFDRALAFEDTNTDKIVRSADLRLLYTPTARDQVEVHAGVSNGPMGRGGDGSPVHPEQSRDIERNYQLLRWIRSNPDGGESRFQAYHSYFAEDDQYTIGRLSDLLGLFGIDPSLVTVVFPVTSDELIDFGIFNYKSSRYDAEWQYNSPWHGPVRYVAGLGGRIDRYESDYLVGPPDSSVEEHLLRGFLNVEYQPVADVILNAGLMVERGDLAETEVSPRLGLNYSLSPNHAARISIARSMRAPSLLEEHFDLAIRANDGTVLDALHITQGGVDAESITAYELGYLGRWPDTGASLDLKLYREIIRDEIDEIQDTSYPDPLSALDDGSTAGFDGARGAWIGFNGSRINIDGFEAQLKYQPTASTLASLQYAYADVDEFRDSRSVKTQVYNLDGTPQHTASLLLSQRFPRGFEASVLASYVDEMAWYGDGDDMDEHTRVDLRLAKRFKGERHSGAIEILVHNIGEEFEVFDRDYIFDTRYYLRASLQFH